jgi:prevent-host-death family protein
MKEINVTKLRQNLSGYLAKVWRGERIRVTSHGRVVTELVPPAPSTEEGAAGSWAMTGRSIRSSSPASGK